MSWGGRRLPVPRLPRCTVVTLLAALLLTAPSSGQAAPAPGWPAASAPAPAAADLVGRLAEGEVHGYRLQLAAAGDLTVTVLSGPSLLLELRNGNSIQVIARRVVAPGTASLLWTVPQLAAGDYTLVVSPFGNGHGADYRFTLSGSGLTLTPGIPRVGGGPGRAGWFRAVGAASWPVTAAAPGPGPVTAAMQTDLVVDGALHQRQATLPATFSLNTLGFADGLHLLALLATDQAGNWAGQVWQMLVDNIAAFTDVPAVHWARAEVELLADLNLTAGYPDGAFRPEQGVTRAEFIKLLVEAAGRAEDDAPAADFADVPAGAWFERYVAVAYQAGWVRGRAGPDGIRQFGPNDRITRAEAALMLIQAAEPGTAQPGTAQPGTAQPGESPPDFRDAGEIPAWAGEAVAQAVARGLVQGYPDGRFGPADGVTRAQAAVLVARWIR